MQHKKDTLRLPVSVRPVSVLPVPVMPMSALPVSVIPVSVLPVAPMGTSRGTSAAISVSHTTLSVTCAQYLFHTATHRQRLA